MCIYEGVVKKKTLSYTFSFYFKIKNFFIEVFINSWESYAYSGI